MTDSLPPLTAEEKLLFSLCRLDYSEIQKAEVGLLKGMALEKTVYGNQGLRQMTDIDVLVNQDVVLELRKIFMKNRYKTKSKAGGGVLSGEVGKVCWVIFTWENKRQEGLKVLQSCGRAVLRSGRQKGML